MTSSISSPVEQMPEWADVLAEHRPKVDALVTEDDTPVDNLFSAKQQRLLVESLYTSWAGPGQGRPFLADTNVGVFSTVPRHPLVPDAFLSLDVRLPDDVWARPGSRTLSGIMTAAETSPTEPSPDWQTILAEHQPPTAALLTEHDVLLSNLFCAKQQRLLVEPLHSSWAGLGEGRPFLVEANLGVFYSVHRPPLVPDVVFSADVRLPDEAWTRTKQAYCIWDYGRPPTIVIDIVLDQQSSKGEPRMREFDWMAVPYFIVVDPMAQLGPEPLRVYIRAGKYEPFPQAWFARQGLGVRLWQGEYEGLARTWVRWCDQAGNVIPTGAERAAAAEQRAVQEHQRAARLAAQLRALGVEPQDACGAL